MALAAVVALLQASRNHSEAVRKSAEQQIMQYFDQSGFGMFLCVRVSPCDFHTSRFPAFWLFSVLFFPILLLYVVLGNVDPLFLE